MKKLFLALTMLLASCQFAHADEKPTFTGEECAALGNQAQKYAYYHEQYEKYKDSDEINPQTLGKYRDEVFDKDHVVEAIKRWHKDAGPYSAPKYIKKALEVIDIAYGADVKQKNYMQVGVEIQRQCDQENQQSNDVITSEKVE